MYIQDRNAEVTSLYNATSEIPNITHNKQVQHKQSEAFTNKNMAMTLVTILESELRSNLWQMCE